MPMTEARPTAAATDTLHIVSADVCPFAQRTRMVLLEKGLDFEHTVIDLREKPAWLKDISPYEKVPVLKHGENRIYESAIINEYIEEVYPEPALMPADPGLRAQTRIWIDFCNNRFIPTYYKLLLVQDEEQRAKHKAKLLEHLQFIESDGLGRLSGEGPYWLGSEVSLLDITWYPFFERFVVAEHYRGVEIPAECERLKRWFAAMSERESAKATGNPREYYIKAYRAYAEGTVAGRTADEFRDS